MHYLDYYYSSYFIDNLQFNEEEIEYPNRDFYQIVLSNKDCIGRCNMVEVIRPKNEDNVVVSSNPTRVFLYTDGKNYDKERYKDTEILLEDFVENNPKKVKNPVLRNIHKAVKEKGEYQMQLTESMKRELERMRAQDKKTIEDQRKQLELKDKEIRELKRQLGLAF